MSSPNEPGSAHDAGSSGGQAPRGGPQQSGSSPAHVAEPGDVPPWQRGPAARARQQQTPDGSAGEARRGAGQQGLDARLNRFIAGGSPAEGDTTSRNERTDTIRPDSARPDTSRPDSARPEAGRADGARPEAARPESRPEGPRPEAGRPDAGRPDGNRTEQAARPEGGKYNSELPDLSGPMPRPAQQRKPAERPGGEQRPPQPNKGVQVATRQHKGPVRASMQIRRIDPWSTLKVSLLLSVALFFVWMIAVAFLYLVLGGMGVWTKLNSNVGDLLTSASGASGGELVSSGTIFGGAALIGLVNIVLLTAAATIGAFIYNLTTDLVGGVEVTLADRD
ncbi:DUF3566 domain-containing protein [uncultured Mycolicibacterium sp.]|uniref:DUF3566 domain-containing protein n=1 Tax=uncultured Mycolicibacterium sp. TaxID=2320817 RepID=UPI0032B25197